MIVNKEPKTATPINWLPVYNMQRLFSGIECKNIVDQAEASGLFVQGRVVGENNTTVTENGRRVDIIRLAGGDLYDMLRERILEYVPVFNQPYQFDLFEGDELFNEIHILKYIEGDFHGSHLDLDGYEEMKNRKLSLIVTLNDDYEGGDLALYSAGTELPFRQNRHAGDAVAFPAWLPHEVRPVDYGVRYVLVIWLRGPQFR